MAGRSSSYTARGSGGKFLPKYTAQKAERICELITEGHTLRQISAQEGIDKSTILRWLRQQPEFRQAYSQAYELWAEMMASDLVDIASDGSNDFMDRETAAGRVERVVDHEHVTRSRLRVDTIKWLMAHRLPKKYGDLVRHTGPQGDDAVAITVDDEERRRKAPRVSRSPGQAPAQREAQHGGGGRRAAHGP